MVNSESEDDYDSRDDFRPYRIELQGPHEVKIYLTDSEIREIEHGEDRES